MGPFGENSLSCHAPSRKRPLTQSSNISLPGKSSLSLALNKSRNMRKRKISFLGGSDSNIQGKSKKQGISLGHVLFETAEKPTPAPSRTVSLTSNESSSLLGPDITKRSTLMSKKSTLWSKVSANGFRSR